MAQLAGARAQKWITRVAGFGIPPWFLPQPMLDLGLLERLRAGEERVDSVNGVSEHLRTQYYAFLNIFTDESKDPKTGSTGAAFSVPDGCDKKTTDHLSVYTKVFLVILMATEWVGEVRPDRGSHRLVFSTD